MKTAKMIIYRLIHPANWILCFLPPFSFAHTHFYLCNQERGQCYGIPDFCTVCIFSDNPDCRLTITGRAAKTGKSKILEP